MRQTIQHYHDCDTSFLSLQLEYLFLQKVLSCFSDAYGDDEDSTVVMVHTMELNDFYGEVGWSR
jgi:hypothetical protein